MEFACFNVCERRKNSIRLCFASSEWLVFERVIPVGDARVDILNAGYIRLSLGPLTRAERPGPERAAVAAALARATIVPMQDVLIRVGPWTILVDAGAYDISPSSPFALAGYRPPPPIIDQLAAREVAARSIDHVVFTHRHFDRCCGATRLRGSEHVPTFENATYHLGAADWPVVEELISDPVSREARVFGVLSASGRLKLVEKWVNIAPGVTIVPAPGETPGHQMVRVGSGGKTLYAVGDLFHHPIEATHPAYMVEWADPASSTATRRHFIDAATAERATIVASHIRGPGQIVADGEKRFWRPAELAS